MQRMRRIRCPQTTNVIPSYGATVVKSLSFRISRDLAERVEDHTRRWGMRTDSDCYRRLIEEWARLQEHPGIRFVDGPAGRRATLVDGPDVWEVVETARAFEFDIAAIVDAYPWLSAEKLEAAKSYADSFPDEIDALIRDNRYVAESLSEELDLVVRERRGATPPPTPPKGSGDS